MEITDARIQYKAGAEENKQQKSVCFKNKTDQQKKTRQTIKPMRDEEYKQGLEKIPIFWSQAL